MNEQFQGVGENTYCSEEEAAADGRHHCLFDRNLCTYEIELMQIVLDPRGFSTFCGALPNIAE